MILDDPILNTTIKERILKERHSPEYVLMMKFQIYRFDEFISRILHERKIS